MPSPARSSPRRPASQGSQSQRSVRSSPRPMTSPSRPQENGAAGSQDNFFVDPMVPQSPFVASTSPPSRSGNDFVSSPLNYGTPSSMSFRTPRSINRATPMRPRIDLGSERNLRQIPLTSESDNATSDQPTLVIWGTDVVFSRCKNKFKNFIETFEGYSIEEDDAVEEGAEPKRIYFDVLNKMHLLEQQYININCTHLQKFDDDLYKKLVSYPQEVIPAFDMIINELFFTLHPDAALPQQIQIRPFNVEKVKSMRNLDPEDIDRLVTINGMVVRSSNIIPDMRVAFFMCSVCNFSTSVEIDRGRIAEPTLCGRCKTSYSFTMVHNRSTFTDKQLVKLQESPDEMPAGQTPHTVSLLSRGDLVDSINPGQRVSVTGIYRAVPIQVNPRMRTVRSIYKTHIDVLHYSTSDAKRLFDQSNKPHEFQPARMELLKALSLRPDLYERLAHSIAPSIFENEDIKKGILLQLFGGTRKVHEITGRNTFRSEINVLLCGDPGTSKSQLLSYVYNLVPKSQYTSGKGSSAVGLTAYVTKDPETRQLVLQTGALVLADNGVCCIDEFDKMNEATRSVLHEVMEQQTLSIAKAGIICQLSARTSVLAAANPVGSEWDKNKTIIDNIRLPHTLLSRFDLIFLILDPQSEIYDRKLAKHLVSLYHKKKEFDEAEELDSTILRDYITFARENIHPTLSEGASNMLVNAYVEMRKVGRGRGQISAYPRQLESLIRLSEAHAKMRMSVIVEESDVEEARRLHREALKQSAVDPLTGKLDVSILTTGLSMAARKKKLDVKEAVMNFLKNKAPGSTIAYQRLLKDLKEVSSMMVPRDVFDEVLKDIQDEGLISLSSKFSIKILQDRSSAPA